VPQGSPERKTFQTSNNFERLTHGSDSGTGAGTYYVPTRHAYVGTAHTVTVNSLNETINQSINRWRVVLVEHSLPPWYHEEAWDFCEFRRSCSNRRVGVAGGSCGDTLEELQAAVSIYFLHDDNSASRIVLLEDTTDVTKIGGFAPITSNI
jgi:hypothetical protein